jgi:Domain of unknown function (DUF4386)
MTNPAIKTSPRLYARICGVLYLINIACGLFGEIFVRGRLVIAGDASATAHGIMASEFLFRCGVAGDLIMHISDVPMTVIFYVLLRPVSRDLSLLGALFSMLQTAILGANKLNLVTVLLLLGGTGYLKVFDPNQLHALASLSLELHGYGFGIGLIFFGFSCMVTGYLMFRSGYFPRILGVLQGIAGVCYLINSFALILDPSLAAKMFPAIVLPAFVGELATCVWLIVKGVNISKWEERIRMGPVIASPTAG